MICDIKKIKKSCSKLLLSLNVKNEISRKVITSLIDSDMSGHPSHGLMRLPSYIDKIISKKLLPNKLPNIIYKDKLKNNMVEFTL